ncbi:DUF4011 domain-containing protein [Staphylococcus kloosii]|uniref:RAP domain-containing protein n=1 Tax=Staphylococcus kloosii TaxID=29384 RepID=A0A151A2Q6_9STAP|nr:DUF4011 domain-containing protein [Staphylococcus kloosii]KYH13708.1 hypothetical protein A0131_02655 [Staphylococcus kloosii]
MDVTKVEENNLVLKTDYIEMINYSLAHNDMALIRNIHIINESEENDLNDLKLKIYSNSEFIYTYEQEIPMIKAENSFNITAPNIFYNYEFFREIVDRFKTHFFIEILDNENNVLIKKPFKINILPFQHWLGTNIYPELTCSYIVSNDEEIRRIVSEASIKLKDWTGSPSFKGYQSEDTKTILLEVAAIYAAIQRENIAYKNPPASFERFGQNIRYPKEIIQYKNGTCLDFAFLFAACIEAVGIHPLVIFTKGHAFVGFWLEDKKFTETYIDDFAAISKRMAQGVKEIEVVEATAFVNGEDISFENAVLMAQENLINPYNFEGIVDISAGRNFGITPIMTQADKSDYSMKDFGERSNVTEAPTTVIEKVGHIDFKVEALEKMDIWSRNLLDLSLRNSMINFKMNKKSIQLMVYDIANLEDELASYEKFKIIEKPENITYQDIDNNFVSTKELKMKFKDLIDSDFKENRIRSFLTEYMLNKQLKTLYRKAKSDLEENGSNSLFLAVGFLKWRESEKSEREFRAPLLLLPLSIEKKSANSNFLLELSEDEPQLNVTLIEYLRQKFNIDLRYLADLPKDEKGIDIPLLFTTIRKVIIDKEGWDIEEAAVISNFSFSKFVMWNDLENRREEISSNPNVQALIKGNYKIDRELEKINAKDIENNSKPHELHLGSVVDASQLEAVKASEQSSFVLHGPPGTGKSQTITNIIINNLNKGKKILFVAEKMAALNVVNNRLSKLGMGDFALELHSNKTKKIAFLDKVEKSLNSSESMQIKNISEKSEYLFKVKKELNNYVEALHKTQNNGYSLYELIQKHEKFENVPNYLNLNKEIIFNLSQSEINRIKDISLIIDNTIKQLRFSLSTHPLRNFEIDKYSISKRDAFIETLDSFKLFGNEIKNDIRNIFDVVEPTTVDSLRGLESYIEIASNYDFNNMIDNNMLKSHQNVSLKMAFNYAKDRLTTYLKNKQELLEKYNEKILEINTSVINSEYKEIQSKLGIFKNRKLKKLIDNFRQQLIEKHDISENEFENDLNKIIEYQEARESLIKNNDNFKGSFGELWQGKATNLMELSKFVYFVEDNKLQSLDKKQQDTLSRLLKLKIDAKDNYDTFKQNFDNFWRSYEILTLEYKLSTSILNNMNLDEISKNIEHWMDGAVDLKNWTLINEQFIKLNNIFKVNIREKIMESSKEGHNVYQLMFKDIISKLIKGSFGEHETLDSFNSFEQEQKIKMLQEKVQEFTELSIKDTKDHLIHNLLEKRNDEAYESDFLFLQKVIRSKGRGQSIRTMFNRTSNIIQDVFPIMLMSPLSIAQYIDLEFPKYDLVIFDEASQIPTDIAVGAISRAKNCIIVGDPKQMPPTKFFGSSNNDEENIDMEDLESLLDDCLAANFPEKHLRWHYRSNHESLIHYSNRTYYNSDLLTYPSPESLTSKVTFENVEGTYKRGKHRNNEEEANVIVSKLINHLKGESEDSIGVITFNMQQQNLIEDLFNSALVEFKELDTKNTNANEPVFIKNLENVQGDERDIILFSTTFGPDEEGKMSMNFGPLNNDGGWRRLNVAITRARKEMKVISSFEPEDIDLKRTKADGVIGLKGFIEFARNKDVLPSNNNYKMEDEKGIALLIKEKLTEFGFQSKIHIGNSDFKIDLGVVDPNNSDKLILAILIDGHNYYNAQTASDRNIIQPNVLESLGWNIHRVWAIDWYEDKEREVNKLLNKLRSLEVN